MEWTNVRAMFQSTALAALLMATTQASANGFNVDFDAWSRDGDPSLSLVIQNQSGSTMRDVRIDASPAGLLDCIFEDASIAQSGLIAQVGNNQSIYCRLDQARESGQSTLVITARDVEDRPVMQRVSLFAPRGLLIVDQGIVKLNSAAVHVDGNSNGVLETGETINYNYRLINLGSLALENLAVTDLDGVVTCPATSLALGANFACSRSHLITAAEAAAGRVDNEVEVLGLDSLGSPVQSSDLIIRSNQTGRTNISVIKSPFLLDDVDSNGFASLGDLIRYDFIVRNTNDEELSNVDLVEPNPNLIDTPIVCAAQTLDGNAFSGIGTGVLSAGDVVLCTAEYEVRQSDVNAGQTFNLVQAFAQTPVGLTIQATGAIAFVIPGGGQLLVEKTTTTPIVALGATVEFEITVTNVGTITLFNVVIDDPLPSGILSFDWTCAGSLCPNPSGTGAINETIPTFPVGGSVVYSIEAVVDPLLTGEIINTVSVLPPGVVICQPGLELPPCRDEAPVLVLDPMAVPTLGKTALGVLMMLMLVLGVRATSRATQD